jgi:hypothetical protein
MSPVYRAFTANVVSDEDSDERRDFEGRKPR